MSNEQPGVDPPGEPEPDEEVYRPVPECPEEPDTNFGIGELDYPPEQIDLPYIPIEGEPRPEVEERERDDQP